MHAARAGACVVPAVVLHVEERPEPLSVLALCALHPLAVESANAYLHGAFPGSFNSFAFAFTFSLSFSPFTFSASAPKGVREG